MDEYLILMQQIIYHTLWIYQQRYKSHQYLMYTQKVKYCADAFNHCLTLPKYKKIFDLDIQTIDNIFKLCMEIIEEYGL